jgi:1-acyl-sn-glycerol-3-phosphate acyltransferase
MLDFFYKTLRLIFFIFVRIFVLLFLGVNKKRVNKLPSQGPAIVVANHNSHLDTLVLISLFPLSNLEHIRPVAAADYFLTHKILAWFSQNIIGIIPIIRNQGQKNIDPLAPCYDALDQNKILILFPEGTRGQPEKLSDFKKGISWLMEKRPEIPVTPIFIHGLGKALPKDKYLPVPFFCDVYVGETLYFLSTKEDFMQRLNATFNALAKEGSFPDWE